MMGGFVEIGSHSFMAVVTNLGLGRLVQDRVPGSMDSVTAGTGDVVTLLHAAFPADVVVTAMAVEAYAVLGFHGLIGLGAEVLDGGICFALDVAAAGTMTTFTLQSGKGGPPVGSLGVFGFEDFYNREFRTFTVTL